ncbi:MAG: small multi-drug export protein [bacterium]|nr:small multi-drug export protein [bacterium]
MNSYVEFFQGLPPELATALIAMMPIGENRVAVPVAMTVYDLPAGQAIFWASVGGIIAAAIIIFFIDAVVKIIRGKMTLADRFLDWFFARTERRFMQKYERWGEIALMLFVAIPLPMTGFWTGSIAAFLFGIKPARALLFISVGVILSACIVAVLSAGFLAII